LILIPRRRSQPTPCQYQLHCATMVKFITNSSLSLILLKIIRIDRPRRVAPPLIPQPCIMARVLCCASSFGSRFGHFRRKSSCQCRFLDLRVSDILLQQKGSCGSVVVSVEPWPRARAQSRVVLKYHLSRPDTMMASEARSIVVIFVFNPPPPSQPQP
jgi:hypothetical protein